MSPSLTRTQTLVPVAVCMLASVAVACNIPVFRYALERWRADKCELIIVHDEVLSAVQQEKIQRLSALGNLLTVSSFKPDQSLELSESELVGAIRSLPGFKSPYAVIRTTVNSQRSAIAWHGGLDQLNVERLLDSPARRELVRRLLKGDSVVWLILQSGRPERNAQIKHLLESELQKLGRTIPFPEGLGLPGSELLAELPLLMQFTVLEVDPSDPREEYLVGLFRGFDPAAATADQPLVVPVFGRGRALEVLSAERLDAGMIGDLSRYLCGACSCQVKERNPGFDLLLQANWDRELFGEEGQLPPPPKEFDPDTAPTLVPIPKGNKP